MTLIGLLRHGEVEGGNRFRGPTDDPLTTAGLLQMYATLTDNDRWDRVISSPLLRCAEFSNAFAWQHSLSLTFDTRLQEMYFGAWEGRSASELMAEDPQALTRFWRDPNAYSPTGGEALADFQARVLAAWNDILSTPAGQRVLIVTHGGVIRVLLCHVLKVPVSRWHEFEVPHGQLRGVHVGADGSAKLACEDHLRM
jgi:alpha-ribazole phosphatase